MKYFSRSILVCHGQLLICLYGDLIVLDGAFQCGHFGYCICLSATLVCWVNGNHLQIQLTEEVGLNWLHGRQGRSPIDCSDTRILLLFVSFRGPW